MQALVEVVKVVLIMQSISLGDSGFCTLVDDEDYEDLVRYHWFLHFAGYASRKGFKDGKHYNLYLHRYLTGVHKGSQVDHINQDKLDNRKSNLRICSRAQNNVHHKLYANNRSGFHGVYAIYQGKWCAAIKKDQKRIHIGVFDTKEEAARARDKKATELFGSFASLNFGE